jgi:hypothetical protein
VNIYKYTKECDDSETHSELTETGDFTQEHKKATWSKKGQYFKESK